MISLKYRKFGNNLHIGFAAIPENPNDLLGVCDLVQSEPRCFMEVPDGQYFGIAIKALANPNVCRTFHTGANTRDFPDLEAVKEFIRR
jgi:hypothetical protein